MLCNVPSIRARANADGHTNQLLSHSMLRSTTWTAGGPHGRRAHWRACRRGSLLLAASSSALSQDVAGQEQANYQGPKLEVDKQGRTRLALEREGWESWQWRGHTINYIAAGSQGPPVVLVHGFGASAYHFRYNIPELSQHCRVYALDCLGFGWSSKPLVDYRAYQLWEDQIGDFIREVVGGDEKVVLVGNSLGGYNSLAAAAKYQDLVRGVVLLNAAGRFEDPNDPATAQRAQQEAGRQQNPLAALGEQIATALKRVVVGLSFIYTKNPLRIKQVLQQVYHSRDSIDEDLIESIAKPAEHPDAAEVFYRIITGRGQPMNLLLKQLNGMPLLLLWGSQDPWCVPARATMIQQYYPSAERVDIVSGHCPHDDTPHLVNEELLRWIKKLEGKN